MTYEHLTLERHGHVGVVTLNRPEQLNALNRQLQEDTRAACAEIEADDDLRVMIVTGTGRGFSAGADLSGPRPTAPAVGGSDEAPSQGQRLDTLSWVGRQAVAFYRMTKPTIAAVNGVAAGAGMSLALACDLRVGTPLSRFKTVFAERSLSPDSGMSWFLPRIVGYSRAIDLIATSRMVDADEAYRIGLLDRLVPEEQLLDASMEVAEQIAALPPLAIRSGKRVTQWNLTVDLETALRNELHGLDYARKAPQDVAESRASWVEKRAPKFTGQ
ncbi:MAG: enoyl-CoA hydratase/isomerase family protein [Dehalococcoidia bacterium]|nr:enoyl-CoA hydratase/isomerase family protein [Dehalococcoidia bacterium]